MTIALRTTATAFLFFLAAVGITYVSATTKEAQPELRPFAYSAFCMFVVLGPLGWIGRGIITTPESKQQDNGTVPVADLITPKAARFLRIVLLGAQCGGLAAGVGFPAFSL